MISEQFKVYENEGTHVFHGSDNGEIAEFEPRQAFSYTVPDGEPAVFASTTLDPAIFMAVLGSRRVAGWDTDSFQPPYGFYIAQSEWDRAHTEKWLGYVYALPSESFDETRSWVRRSTEKVKPVDKILVSIEDLPKTITVLSDQEEAAHRAKNTPEKS